ncbi:MAG: hypothetical protein RL199_1585, partial [Pseudomonadota bacterium]
MKGAWPLAVAMTLACACAGTETAPEAGENWFADASVSTSPLNRWSCATCHTVGQRVTAGIEDRRPGALLPGYDLAQAPSGG